MFGGATKSVGICEDAAAVVEPGFREEGAVGFSPCGVYVDVYFFDGVVREIKGRSVVCTFGGGCYFDIVEGFNFHVGEFGLGGGAKGGLEAGEEGFAT